MIYVRIYCKHEALSIPLCYKLTPPPESPCPRLTDQHTNTRAPRAEASNLLMMIHDLIAAAAAAYMCMDAHASCRRTGKQASKHACMQLSQSYYTSQLTARTLARTLKKRKHTHAVKSAFDCCRHSKRRNHPTHTREHAGRTQSASAAVCTAERALLSDSSIYRAPFASPLGATLLLRLLDLALGVWSAVLVVFSLC